MTKKIMETPIGISITTLFDGEPGGQGIQVEVKFGEKDQQEVSTLPFDSFDQIRRFCKALSQLANPRENVVYARQENQKEVSGGCTIAHGAVPAQPNPLDVVINFASLSGQRVTTDVAELSAYIAAGFPGKLINNRQI